MAYSSLTHLHGEDCKCGNVLLRKLFKCVVAYECIPRVSIVMPSSVPLIGSNTVWCDAVEAWSTGLISFRT